MNRAIPLAGLLALDLVVACQPAAHSTMTSPPGTVASIELSVTSDTLLLGDTLHLVALVKGPRAEILIGQPLLWTSSQPSIATVSSSGRVVANAAGGPVTISATAGEVAATATIFVLVRVPTPVLISPSDSLYVTGTLGLTGYVVDQRGQPMSTVLSWTSSDPAVASVSAGGLVTGVSVGGPVTIQVETAGKTASVLVTVVPSLTLAGRLVFAGERNGVWGIYSVLSDGSHLTRLYDNTNASNTPSVSWPLNRIFFAKYRAGTPETLSMTPSGSDVAHIAFGIGGVASPDGQSVAYVANYDLWLLSLRDGNHRNLTQQLGTTVNGPAIRADRGSLAWSPDGSRIAIQLNDGTCSTRLYIVDTTGSSTPALVAPNVLLHGGPTWSPDGQMLAFTGFTFLGWANLATCSFFTNPSNRYAQLFTVRPDGSALTQVPIPGEVITPAWSPDGRSIALSVAAGGVNGFELRILDAATGKMRSIPTSLKQTIGPVWGPL